MQLSSYSDYRDETSSFMLGVWVEVRKIDLTLVRLICLTRVDMFSCRWFSFWVEEPRDKCIIGNLGSVL